MPPVRIPELKRKFELLRTYSPYKDWDALAAQIGRSAKTIQGWIQDDRGREAGSIPAFAVDKLIVIISQSLPGLPSERVRDLICGPAMHLEDAFRAESAPLLRALLERDAIRGQAALFKKSLETGLIEMDEPADASIPAVLLGQPFRIEFPQRQGCPHICILQNAARNWGVVPFMADEPQSRLYVPGIKPDGDFAFMRERTDGGIHRFYAILSPAPFPSKIREYNREAIALDKQALELLATFYASLPRAQRTCYLLELRIEKDHHDRS